jgi:hypothetical protein
VLGLFALGLGALIRNTVGAIAALVATIFVVPALIDALPPSLKDTIAPYLPTNAATPSPPFTRPRAPWRHGQTSGSCARTPRPA